MLTQLTDTQQKNHVNTEQLYSVYRDLLMQSIEYRGGMSWKTVGGHDYLYRMRDRKGNARSLGARSEETEEIYKNFVDGRESVKSRLALIKSKLDEQARLNKALRIARCPNVVAKISETLDFTGMLGKGIEIIGTNALYAYEAMSGVFVLQESLETSDVDLLFDGRAKISLFAPEENLTDEGIFGILKKADPSFQKLKSASFRAVNKDGFLVDLIRQSPNPPWRNEPAGLGQNDLIATDIWNMKWILSMPKVSQTVIAQNGYPFRMVVPDPRAFALFKYWLSRSEERNPQKKGRDRHQAGLLVEMIVNHLPQYPINTESLKSFPSEVVSSFLEEYAIEERQGYIPPF